MSRIQTSKKKKEGMKQHELATLGEQLEKLSAKFKAIEEQEVDHLEVVATELKEELNQISPFGTKEVLNRVITFHQNKEEERRLKTLRKEKIFETENEDFDAPPLPPLKRKNAASHSSSAKKLKVDAVKETHGGQPSLLQKIGIQDVTTWRERLYLASIKRPCSLTSQK
ncbi:hypothetical protein E5676_scaffold177G001590 [Cucumis melo var. makuwa]|uniref:Uncharacterized protein n=1 Tax=Cucumis melo var. makuwa TaxID=1194695 RepID=A0A5D3CLC9_CUCMM|nr:hypothetical protein E5676_scaffold177G001590 [Cucumis melo var. makuwa]